MPGMIEREWRRRCAAIALALALVLAGFGGLLSVVPVRAQTVNAAGANAFQVTAVSGLQFTPNTFENVASGTNVTVTFTDADTLAHTFTIYGRQGVALSNPSAILASTLTRLVYGSGYAPLVNLNASTGNGQQLVVVFQAPAPGWYEFMCMQSGHFQAGMYGYIAFGEPLPGNLTVQAPNTGPGAAVFIIVGTIVALVVIALVLGFVVGRRRGSEFEMPPQRLGYAEPAAPTTVLPTGGSDPASENAPKG